jgi:small-conductance mechanosensitive channel
VLAPLLAGRIERYLDSSQNSVAQFLQKELPKRVRPVLFLISIALCTELFQQITWASNSFVLSIVERLVTAWVVINLFSIVALNRFVFRVISLTLWTIAALSIVGVLPKITKWLDSNTISLGESEASFLTVINGTVLLIVLFWAVNFASNMVERGLKRAHDVSPSMQVLLSKIVRIVLFIGAMVIALRTVGIDLTVFAVFSGAIGVGIGFGLQNTVSNFISGISLLLDKSIKPGDVISVGDTFGWITSLNTRYTSVVTRDGREHLIPNEDLITQPVINWSFTDSKVRLEVPFGVTYDADPHQVRSLIEAGVQQHARILSSPKPNVYLREFGDSSLNFVFRFWIRDPSQGIANIQSDVLFAIWDVLKENNIEIPYPKRDLALQGGLKVQIERGPPVKRPKK